MTDKEAQECIELISRYALAYGDDTDRAISLWNFVNDLYGSLDEPGATTDNAYVTIKAVFGGYDEVMRSLARHDLAHGNGIVARIDRDYLYDGKDSIPNHVGTHWTSGTVMEHMDLGQVDTDYFPTEQTRFRLLDDDDEVYYEGWLLNDWECAVQITVLSWGTYDSGCTTIEVKKNDEWVREIG